ncbi:LysR family transcriptional regulator [Microbacterium awajiense]|uniref:LysR family transcriptional regulator n=1 Tax=Microbacterium awajiense TaxID=415214 RepID=A0ABP7AHA6_9MICO
MQIAWLRAFTAVVDHGTVVAAATALGRPQSRVSSYVSQLESELGVVLIDRSRRPLDLTTAGHTFLPHARAVLRTLATADDELAHLGGHEHGTVRLACIPSIAGAYAPSLVDRFARTEPSVVVRLQEMATSAVPPAIVERRADLALVPVAYLDGIPEIESLPLWTEKLVVVVSDAHRLATRRSLSPRELADEFLVTSGSGEGMSGLSPEVRPFFAREGLRPEATRRVASPHTLVALVRRGVAVSIVNELALAVTGTAGLVVIPFGTPDAQRRIAVAWRRGDSLSPASLALRRFIVGSRPPSVATR